MYAALRQIQRQSVSPRSLCSLEDPIEALVPVLAQSQIQPHAGFTYEVGSNRYFGKTLKSDGR